MHPRAGAALAPTAPAATNPRYNRSRSGFHDRDLSVLETEDKEEDWDSCVMEGYLQIRAGKMGTGKHKQKYFRMRDTMMVQYKKKSNKGKYGKGSARYTKVRPRPLAHLSHKLSTTLAKRDWSCSGRTLI